MKPLLPFISLLLLLATSKSAEEESKFWKHPEPMTYESLHQWHQDGGLKAYHWPKQHRIDLNDDFKEEILLGIAGYGRGMTYALFSQVAGNWVLLCAEVEGSHHPIRRLPKKHDGWHDFQTFAPNGRGGLFEFTYVWDGKQYTQESSRERGFE